MRLTVLAGGKRREMRFPMRILEYMPHIGEIWGGEELCVSLIDSTWPWTVAAVRVSVFAAEFAGLC